jgi:hypothetical protein
MSKIVKVASGDYSLQVQAGGNIIFDTTGTAIGRYTSGTYGKVTIWGNLDVKGTSTAIETTTSVLNDNILEINSGGSGAVIAGSGTAGLQIDRGDTSAGQFLFNENVSHYDAVLNTEVTGTFLLDTVTVNPSTRATTGAVLNGLQLRTLVADSAGDLVFDLQGGAKALSIVNSGATYNGTSNTLLSSANNYANLGLSAWHIPNVQYLNNYVASSFSGSGAGQALVSTIQYPSTPTISGVIIAGTGGQFTCNTSTLFIGMQVTISGTLSGTGIGGITGYSNPTVYQISATNTYNTFTLRTYPGNAAIVTTAGATTGLTFSNYTYAQIVATGTSQATGSLQFFTTPNTNPNPMGYFATVTGVTASGITTSTNGSLTVGSVRIYGDTINDISSNNLTLTANSGTVEVNAYTRFDNQTALTYSSGTMNTSTAMYSSSTVGPGRTGLYIVNSTQQTPDELISRKRAVLLSILL